MALSHPTEPVLHAVPIKDLRPTQMTVGMHEVRRKRDAWEKLCQQAEGKGGAFLGTHMIPAVVGPGGEHWLVDHHHLALALHEAGEEKVLVSVIAKLQHLPKKRFMAFMDSHNWLHPYDEDGERRDWKDLPRHVGKLQDDPYRSLAGEVRRAGGYAKSPTPYTEFLWADYFRSRIKRGQIDDKFAKALARGVELARIPEAAYLPGYAGPDHGGGED